MTDMGWREFDNSTGQILHCLADLRSIASSRDKFLFGSKAVGGQHFADLPGLKKKLPVKFDEVTNRTVELIDVVWLQGNAIIAAFEIESTTSVYSGIVRLADLIAMQPNINIPLYLVAPDERRNKVFAKVDRPVFSRLSPPMSEMCRFIFFSALRERLSEIASVLKFLKPDFLEDLSEFCEVDYEVE
jgi:hypothetical protein